MTHSNLPNLGNIIESPKKRKVVFAVYGIAAIVLAAIGAYFNGANIEIPAWLNGANSVALLFGTLTSGLAIANAPSATPPLTPYTPLASPTE